MRMVLAVCLMVLASSHITQGADKAKVGASITKAYLDYANDEQGITVEGSVLVPIPNFNNLSYSVKITVIGPLGAEVQMTFSEFTQQYVWSAGGTFNYQGFAGLPGGLDEGTYLVIVQLYLDDTPVDPATTTMVVVFYG